jgi:hypothetical protein
MTIPVGDMTLSELAAYVSDHLIRSGIEKWLPTISKGGSMASPCQDKMSLN